MTDWFYLDGFYFDLALVAFFGLFFFAFFVVFLFSFPKARLRRKGFATSEAVFAGILAYPPPLAFFFALTVALVG